MAIQDSFMTAPARSAAARKNVFTVVAMAYAAVALHNAWIAARGGLAGVPMIVFGLCQLTPALAVAIYDRRYARRLGQLLSRTGGWRPMLGAYVATAMVVGACIALPYALGLCRVPYGAAMTVSYPLRALIPDAWLAPGYFWLYVLVGAPFLHLLTAMGEEILWRGYLLDEMLKAFPSRRKIYLVNGVLWGFWHLPMIVLLRWDFPEHPLLGPLLIVASQIVWSLVLIDMRLKTDSLWPVIVMHAVANAMTIGLYDRMVDHAYNPVFSPWGLCGGLAMAVVAKLTVRAPHAQVPGPAAPPRPAAVSRAELRGAPRQGLELLEVHGGVRYYLFEEPSSLPMAEICDLVNAAWEHDYRDRAVIRFDRDYLRWLMPENQFFGILALDDRGAPVGLELGLDRVIRVHGDRHRVSYVTLLTVHPEARGRGIAQRILRCLTRHAVEARGAELLISVFDDNAAGMPTVEKSLRAGEAWAMTTSPAYPIWAAAPDLAEVDRYEPLKGAARLALVPGIRQLLQFKPKPVASGGRLSDEAAAALPAGPGGYAVAFEPEASLVAMYAASAVESARELRIEFPGPKAGSVSYHLLEVMRPGLPDRAMAQIQMIQPGAAAPGLAPLGNRELVDALRLVNARLFRAGAICAFLVNSTGLATRVLLRAGFLPTERKVRVALRGPRALINSLGELDGRWLVDIL